MRSYLKENYRTAKLKAKKHWTTLIITKIIYFYWIVLPIVIGITWWKVLIGFFCDALHSRFNSIVFQLAHVVEETTNPSPNELGEMDNTWGYTNYYYN
jgi:linoleoyl-CoA desaturase